MVSSSRFQHDRCGTASGCHNARRTTTTTTTMVFLVFVALLTPTEAWRGPQSLPARSSRQERSNSVAFLNSLPRGGANETTTTAKGAVVEEEPADVTDNEEEEESAESVVQEIEAEVEELVEEVAEEIAEEVAEELAEEVAEEVVEAIEAEVEEEEEEEEELVEDAAVEEDAETEAADDEEEEVVEELEEEVVVFPTDEIPSDDVRSFHTTDGELADDEGMYTDGQNESPMIVESDPIAVPAGGGDDDGETPQEEEVSPAAVETATALAVIDDELKKVLTTELRYTEEDVALMRPDIAREVVLNCLVRPTEGMPKNWYTDPDAAVRERPLLARLLGKHKKKVLVSLAVGIVAALAFKENDAVEDLLDALQEVPKSLVAMAVGVKNSVAPKAKPAETTPEPPAADTENDDDDEDTEKDESEEKTPPSSIDFSKYARKRYKKQPALKPYERKNRERSIVPGTLPAKAREDAGMTDQTLLDKAITGFQNFFSAIWNKKI